MPVLRIRVRLEPEEDGSFHAYCPALKGLHVHGETRDEAFRRAQEAIRLYLKSIARHGDPLPLGPDCVLEEDAAPADPHARFMPFQWPPLLDQHAISSRT